MRYCEFCGNEVSHEEEICPYCEQPLQQEEENVTRKYITIRIKSNFPTCEEAIVKLYDQIKEAKISGVKIIKVIHGYGSSGKGGELRFCLREYMDSLEDNKFIRYYMIGEEFSRQYKMGKKILHDYPKLVNDKDLNRFNKGITLIAL